MITCQGIAVERLVSGRARQDDRDQVRANLAQPDQCRCHQRHFGQCHLCQPDLGLARSEDPEKEAVDQARKVGLGVSQGQISGPLFHLPTTRLCQEAKWRMEDEEMQSQVRQITR